MKESLHKFEGKKTASCFKFLLILAIIIPMGLFLTLLISAAKDGIPYFNWKFITSFPSRFPHKAGIFSALVGSLYLMGLTALFAIPLGLGAAVYLEEYAPKNKLTALIEININNLAGVPSVIYGLLGLSVFVRHFRMGRSLLAGAITLSLLLVPVIITASREALKTVPDTLREGGLSLGAEHWTTVRKIVLPMSLPGILTGIILSLSRGIGETAPLVTIGALTYIAFLPDSPFSSFTALPIQIFNWVSRPQKEFHFLAAAGILLLLLIMLLMNSFAIFWRNRLQKRLRRNE